jgi:hypothetical protein
MTYDNEARDAGATRASTKCWPTLIEPEPIISAPLATMIASGRKSAMRHGWWRYQTDVISRSQK